MEVEVSGAQDVMGDKDWKFAINYIDRKKNASTSEAVCNGIWNEILRRNFPYPKFIIAPEQRQNTGKRPDFTIFFVDKTNEEWHPIFTFEGKAPYHGDKKHIIGKGIDQAAGYVPSLAWSKHREFYENKKLTYGMFACGKSFLILQWNVDTGQMSRIDSPSTPENGEFTTSFLDYDAESFDTFCKKHADSFK
ncbi:hypothetical protein FMEXI_14126 [Fusarium mexicanum]|uniref:Uncharacterized protein n=1 Tax=Fusarium mexicanum TaxID=751941 RepID=A0A8H5I3K8_9HYPO|nr:hypothetical protein FMEXI_14126 [Fusarium mexicanum]